MPNLNAQNLKYETGVQKQKNPAKSRAFSREILNSLMRQRLQRALSSARFYGTLYCGA